MTDSAADRVDPTGWAGYRAHSRARSTGTLIVLLDGDAAGLDTDTGRWQTLCDDHGTVVAHTTLRDARSWMAAPQDWCDGCRDLVDAAASTG